MFDIYVVYLLTSDPKSSRLTSIIEASKNLQDSLHKDIEHAVKIDTDYRFTYHKSCVSKYILAAKRACERSKRSAVPMDIIPGKKTQASIGTSFDYKKNCFFCGDSCSLMKDPKHPD